MTVEFVKWAVGDSYSCGPLCKECLNALPVSWTATGLDSPHIPALVVGADV